MPSLWNLTDQARDLYAALDAEGLDDKERAAVIARHRECTQEELPAKVEARIMYIKDKRGFAHLLAKEAKKMAARAKTLENVADGLEADTHYWLKGMGLKEYRAGVFTAKIVGCGGVQTMEMEMKPDEVPALYADSPFVEKIPASLKWRTGALRAELEAGRAVPTTCDGEDSEGNAVNVRPVAKLLPRGTRLSI